MDLRKIMPLLLLICFCFALLGCETTAEKIEKADAWIEDNMW